MMKVTVNVKVNARQEGVERLPSGELRVSVNAPAREGKANDQVQTLLARHFGVSKSRVALVQGHKSRRKVFQVG